MHLRFSGSLSLLFPSSTSFPPPPPSLPRPHAQDFDYQWLIDEVKQNLPLELDFLHEAENAAQCRVNLLSSRSRLAHRVYVPEVGG